MPSRTKTRAGTRRKARTSKAAKPEAVAADLQPWVDDGRKRCGWVKNGNTRMVRYHDEEWGFPVHDDRRHFEFLVLEAAQAGLSWSTVLNKRDGYRRLFAEFDPVRVARFNGNDVRRLLRDAGIIRNRLKIEAAIANARAFLEVQKEFGSFDAYLWRFVGGKPIVGQRRAMGSIPPSTRESDALSKDLKRRGFSFVGSTVMYAHMQAVGLVNDHTVDCFRYGECVSA
jgi:DNA-3-methyladenine glycosylase I